MNESPPSCKSCGSWWQLPLLLAIVLMGVWLLRDWSLHDATLESNESKPTASAEARGKTVALTIDYGEGRLTEFRPIAWREGITVRDVTSETPRQDMKMEIRGTGPSAFLANLDGIENEGTNGRNWMYSVNGRPGDRSFAIYELKPGDQVLWTFGAEQ
jgi:hypothetical protein